MEGTEIEGKTIDEAIENACRALRVPREKLNIEIISEGTSGFLGMGAKKALIRASLLSFDIGFDAPAGAGGRSKQEDSAGAPQAPAPPAERGERERRVPPAAATTPPLPATPDGEPAAEKAQRLLGGLLNMMQIDSPIAVEETEEAIILSIRGDGSGLLIGKRGQNLDAIQYFVNKATHRSANGHKMIIIDTEDYRKRREESLVALAMRLGEKVKKTQKPVTVGHMNAHDRRVIHLAMQNDTSLTTKSRGEGEYRKIVILPARKGPDRSED
ncbi:MAG: RNA-binding cell elongation regulator Jag/EloR [Syntrophales bacterium]